MAKKKKKEIKYDRHAWRVLKGALKYANEAASEMSLLTL